VFGLNHFNCLWKHFLRYDEYFKQILSLQISSLFRYPIFFNSQLEGGGSILPQWGEGAVNGNILLLFPKYCILFRHSHDFTNKVLAPLLFYHKNSGIFLNFPIISWSKFFLSRVLRSKHDTLKDRWVYLTHTP
jgi:hypothetical protein